ncbi:MAG: 7-carboxy-7-deazaguanine synthase QueE [Elusimicrobiota bacterium]
MSFILDVFASRQGEGLRVGEPQVFVRFGGCNLVCNYCDTPESIPEKAGFSVTLQELIERIAKLDQGVPGSVVSLTGGEPLLQIAFLEQLLPLLKKSQRRVYLETNGTLPQALERVIGHCDWVAMDIKPPSATEHDFWEAHRWFLNVGGDKIFVKMVLTGQTTEAEFLRAVNLVAGVRRDIPFILQPATDWGTAQSIPMARLVSWWGQASHCLKDVRILPQIHRLWEIP